MDNIDAPQWTDFTAPSPQVSVDDYFLKKNKEYEYRDKLEIVDLESPNVSLKKPNQSKLPLSEISFGNNSVITKTPVRATRAKSKGSSARKNNSIKETMYENVISEALNNLQLSLKKGDKSFNKSCLSDTPEFKTPNKRFTRSMCSKIIETPKINLEESHFVTPAQDKSVKFQDPPEHNEENKENVDSEEHDNSNNEQLSEINLEVTVTSAEFETSHEKSEPEPEPNKANNSSSNKEIIEKPLPKSKIVTSFATNNANRSNSGNGLKKKFTQVTGHAWQRQLKRRLSITNQRRISIAKNPVKTANKYVSMAEAVNKFHKITPQRFHSVNVKTTRTELLRRQSMKLTRATSPALTCKNRNRPITALSAEEKERLELEKIRQNQIKANPVRKDILKKPAPLKKVEKKMVTNPEPFHLTETKKGQLNSKPQEIKRTLRPIKKTVPSIVSSDDKGIIVKEEEVLYFGIPCKTKKLNTKVQPFSFEARNRELELKKMERLKKLQEEENQKSKAGFHARPVPAAVKTPSNKPLNNSSHKPKITIARSLSFEERIKEQQKKKEEKIKQMLEEEKKMRTFKAQKVPEFKPVLVRGRSRDNLKKSTENIHKQDNASCSTHKTNISVKKTGETISTKTTTNSIKKPLTIPNISLKKNNSASAKLENQENKNLGAIPKILEPKHKISQKSIAILTELNTDRRAKQRKEFEEHLKHKELEEMEMKKREEQERLEKEKMEMQELRKTLEHKAKPMPVYKPLSIIKSNKPLTDAQSPEWASRR